MSNTFWSDFVQSAEVLDNHRDLRFKDSIKDQVIDALQLRPGMSVLEVGSGAGTLSRKLGCWLGSGSLITGLDRDSRLVEYASSKARELGLKGISFLEGDALSIPFEDNSFDACTSHTVIEHVPNKEFLLEQKRVCKPGGKVSVMSARPEIGLNTLPEGYPAISEREQELAGMLDTAFRNSDFRSKICAYPIKPREIVQLFEELQFKDISVDFIQHKSIVDDSRNSFEDKVKIIEEARLSAISGIKSFIRMFPDTLTSEQQRELHELITNRFDARVETVRKGIRIWDFSLSSIMVVCGTK